VLDVALKVGGHLVLFCIHNVNRVQWLCRGNSSSTINSKVAFTLRALRRNKAAPVCSPSAPHSAARRRTAPHIRRHTAPILLLNRSRFDFAV